MRTDTESADQRRTIEPHHAFLIKRRNAWYSNDDGTAASLPAVLSRQIHRGWIGEDGRLDPALTCSGSTPLELAYAHHALSSDDPLDAECNQYPAFGRPKAPAARVAEPLNPQGNRYPDLYFIGAEDGPIKIGISVNPQSRLKALQTGYPFRLKILALIEGAALSESEYHARFTEHRLSGEWFARAPEILAEIDRLNQRVMGYE